MKITPLYPNSFAAVTYLVEDAGHAVIVDPGAPIVDIERLVASSGCTLNAILLTHGHFDHIMSIDLLRDAYPGLPVYIHEADAPMLTDGDKNAYTTFFRSPRAWHPADVLLTDGQTVTVGNATLTVIHTPGHSPGSICFFNEDNRVLLSGDTLFADNIGRCDLWGGNHAVMMTSLRSLREFSDTHPGVTIYPGHGDTNTLKRALDNAVYYF